MAIFLTLSEVQLTDYSGKVPVYLNLPPGFHEVEVVDDEKKPVKGLPGRWFVLRGTSKGASEAVWRHHMTVRKKSARKIALQHLSPRR